jgi:glycosyltransferase involved in cell wall biosynthesis
MKSLKRMLEKPEPISVAHVGGTGKGKLMKANKTEWNRMNELEYFGVGDFSQEEIVSKAAFIKNLMRDRIVPERPLISVIVPAHKEEKYILATLRSLAEQTNQNCEFIIVVNGEQRGNATERIAEMSGFHVINDPQSGISRARQTGLMAAKGDIVVTTDADSVHHSKWLDRISEIMVSPNIMCGAGLWRTTSEKFSVRLVFSFIAWTHRMKNAINPMLITGVSEASSFYRRDAALACGGYDPAVVVSEGVMMFKKFRKPGVPIIFTDEELVVFTSGRRQEQQGALRWFLTGFYNAVLQFFGSKGVGQKAYPALR